MSLKQYQCQQMKSDFWHNCFLNKSKYQKIQPIETIKKFFITPDALTTSTNFGNFYYFICSTQQEKKFILKEAT